MIGWIADQVRRGRLRPLVATLPHLLKRRYGAAEFYTAPPQVETGAGLLKIRGKRLIVAYAMACTADEFLKAVPKGSVASYASLRSELARLFWTDESRLNCRDLTRTFDNPVGSIDDTANTLGVTGSD